MAVMLMACAAGAACAAVVCAGNFASGWQWHDHGARAPLGPDLGLGEVRANEVAGCRAPTTCGVPRSIGPLVSFRVNGFEPNSCENALNVTYRSMPCTTTTLRTNIMHPSAPVPIGPEQSVLTNKRDRANKRPKHAII